MTPAPEVPAFKPGGVFFLRTPLLPCSRALALSHDIASTSVVAEAPELSNALAVDRGRVRERLRRAVLDPIVREALLLAAPDLESRIGVWLQQPESRRGRRIESALVRYYFRMSMRSTPFGLFAGCSVGRIGTDTVLDLAPIDEYERHTRLDMQYVCALLDGLAQDPGVLCRIPLRPNSSLHRTGNRLRYSAANVTRYGVDYRLVDLEETPYLTAILHRAREGALLSSLNSTLGTFGASEDEALTYVKQLVEAQVLVSDLSPVVTGLEPVPDAVHTLRDFRAPQEAGDSLDRIQQLLDELDSEPLGCGANVYERLQGRLQELPPRLEAGKVLQADLIKPARDLMLGRNVIDELVRAVELLRSQTPQRRREELITFTERFEARYGQREVPLQGLFDEQTGIGFPEDPSLGGEPSPLLQNVAFPQSEDRRVRWTEREDHLLKLLSQALEAGNDEILLESEDLHAMEVEDPARLPDAFSVRSVLVAESATAVALGQFRLVFSSTFGPSGARLLGRFCHGSREIRANVEKHLRSEEALRPDAIFAEVVHLPVGRVGNILLRPSLRDYEIPYLGRSGVHPSRQIPVEDLSVRVADGRIILSSIRLGKEVIPRLTSAHATESPRNLQLYRFLCALQAQDCAEALAWHWGALEGAPYLPRVRSRRVVLSRARWRLNETEIARIATADDLARFRAVRELRAQRRLPRLVGLADGDNVLVTDLDNPLSTGALAHAIKNRRGARLVEVFAWPSELCVSGPEGKYANEIVVPFVSNTTPVNSPPNRARRNRSTRVHRRTFLPGGDWLYVKVYTSPFTADELLRRIIGPMGKELRATAKVSKWFFIRYGDPAHHIRLRLHGDSDYLCRRVLPTLHESLRTYASESRLYRVQVDTYEREVERYGGLCAALLAESTFCADSEAVIEMLHACVGDAGAEMRWRAAILGVDALFTDFEFDLGTKSHVAAQLAQSLKRQFRVDGSDHTQQFARKFRTLREHVEEVLDRRMDSGMLDARCVQAIARRSSEIAPVVARLRELASRGYLTQPIESLAGSFTHMFVNRLLRAEHNRQELVLYDLLTQAYRGRIARRRAMDTSAVVKDLPRHSSEV